ncbi:MAG: hypothetical protein ACREQ5_02075 [Candidatus Dormibacteria bacterium]
MTAARPERALADALAAPGTATHPARWDRDRDDPAPGVIVR